MEIAVLTDPGNKGVPALQLGHSKLVTPAAFLDAITVPA